MLLAILLMGVLLAWFFLAKVTLYENSLTLKLGEEGRLYASFSPEGQRRLRQGQSVILRLDMGPDQPALTLPAMVYDLQADSDQVELIILSDQIPPELQNGKINGRAEVEVEYITPVQLLVRATGKMLVGNEIPVSPQDLQPAQPTQPQSSS